LFGDVPQSLTVGAGGFTRNETEIAPDLLAAGEAIGRPDDQHEGQCCNRSDTGMSHQPQDLGPFVCLLLDGRGELSNGPVQSIHQFQQVLAAAGGPWSQQQ